MEITLGLLNAVHKNEALTQRSVANDLGVALGLVNTYLKRCVRKGYVKIQQAPRNRYAYYLTPIGFAEKSRLTAEYLAQGFKFFGLARREIQQIYRDCVRQGWARVVIYGQTDLTDIALLCASDTDIRLVAIVAAGSLRTEYTGVPVVGGLDDLPAFDAILIADTADPQTAYETIVGGIPDMRILAPGFLNISRKAS
ncbi:MAG: uncharacterized protein K0Q70_2138 [Rhodospirillales bacterium]|nr:uncharacterized protein [Rhodospirillales bacterium]